VFGLCLGWWLMVKGWGIYGRILWGVGTLALVSGFAVTAYKGARGLSGAAPMRFTWIPVNLPGDIAAYERASRGVFATELRPSGPASHYLLSGR
jgi:hypothetical protein